VMIYEQQVGDAEPAHNPIWFRVDEGWIHSSLVQPVRNELNTSWAYAESLVCDIIQA